MCSVVWLHSNESRPIRVTSMPVCIALLRGINVGKAKRIAMADLRSLIETLGYSRVRTLLNSGNVVFEANKPDPVSIATAIETGIKNRFGLSVAVVVVAAADLNAIIEDDPLLAVAGNAAKHLVAFVSCASELEKAKPLLTLSWQPDAIALGPLAAYLWCANGVINSKLMQAFVRVTGNAATTRNWATVLKLQTLAENGKSD